MILSVVLALLLLGSGAPPDDTDPPERRALRAHPVDDAVALDGRLDEPAWRQAPVADGFRQYVPDEGAAPSLPTEVRVLYGDDALYVGATLHDDQPDRILQTLGRRDAFNQADWFQVSIDSHDGGKMAYTFAVNAAGVQVDGITTGWLDTSWDAVWASEARVGPDGWTVEMRIPYAMLRFPEADVQAWGINFRRTIPRFGETDEWVLIPRSERGGGIVSRFGQLNGLRRLDAGRSLQVRPYSVGRAGFVTEDDVRQRSGSVDAGADVKLGLTPSFTLDATFNPDFGQVENDPAVLNLSAFETYFPERRPFFVEGADIFSFGLDGAGELLYTRRIGADAPIVTASKLSGRTEDGLSVGVMGALTGTAADPEQAFGAARLRQDVRRHSSVGAMLTGYRGLDATSGALGTDWDVRFGGNRYRVGGFASVSHRAPDQDATSTGVAFATGFNRLQGLWRYDAGVQFYGPTFEADDYGRVRRNDFYRIRGGVRRELNGGEPFGPFQRGSAHLTGGQSVTYRDGLSTGAGFYGGVSFDTRRFQYLSWSFSSDYLFGGYDPFDTRGLGPRARPTEYGTSLRFGTDDRRPWRLVPSAGVSGDADGALGRRVNLYASWNASERLNLSGEVGYDWNDDRRSWASNETFVETAGAWAVGADGLQPGEIEPGALTPVDGDLSPLFAPLTPYEAEAGVYYASIFGRRDTRTAEMSLRSNVTFTPDLSLQVFGQVYLARGHYDRFELLQDPDTWAPLDAYPNDHDFAFNSLQTNVVLRWEYRPGSTLYVVWSHARDQYLDADLPGLDASPYDVRPADQLFDTFRLVPDNVFVVKLNYLFLS